MYEDKNNNDIERILRRSGRKRRSARVPAAVYAGIAALVLIAAGVIGRGGKKPGDPAQTAQTGAVQAGSQEETILSPEEQARAEHEAMIEDVIASYDNLGIVTVEGSLNIHEAGAQESDIIGKLTNGSACDILDTTPEGWLHISSGGLEGYVHPDYVKTGEEARALAKEEIALRAIVLADRLIIRKEPTTEADALGVAIQNERYLVREEQDGWVRTKDGWLSKDYLSVEYALNEARPQDLRSMVLNMYNNLGVSMVTSYLNIRETPEEDGVSNIIGKLTAKAGCDVLGVEGDWLKIHSGDITGYVKAEYIATGLQAQDEAVQNAQLMAVVNTDILNARTEPSQDAVIWTQITNSERYPVLEQLDGWVKIELEEEESAYVNTDFVDVRYALNEAIRFSPMEEAAMKSASLRQQIVNYAIQFCGNPYVWGGTSLTHGCDCSGFTMKVMENFGVSLPHYSGSQATMGTKVTSETMRPGDLVFYGNSSGRINHVGIYIGNGQIVNAQSRRSGIRITNWDYRRPKAIRNVLGD